MNTQKAVRCRKLITLAGEAPARGAALYAPLAVLDDAVVISRGGIIEGVEPYSSCKRRPGLQWADFGEATACPAFVNAHSHLQLAHLGGKTLLGQGFTPWLKSLVALLRLPVSDGELAAAARKMRACGAAFVADYTGPATPRVAAALASAGLEGLLLHECFGFDRRAWLDAGRIRAPEVVAACNGALAGHALYSTDGEILRAARLWCAQNKRPFAIHLAESADEVECLATGRGAMADFFRERVYPPGWRAPGQGPTRLADSLGLLGSGVLAVHAVQCSRDDVALLAGRGAAVCLCPRSNAAIGVGAAPVKDFIAAGVLLCLGTDSMASNHSLDLTEEAALLARQFSLPPRVLLRMLTINGAAALGLESLGALAPGKSCALAAWPFHARLH